MACCRESWALPGRTERGNLAGSLSTHHGSGDSAPTPNPTENPVCSPGEVSVTTLPARCSSANTPLSGREALESPLLSISLYFGQCLMLLPPALALAGEGGGFLGTPTEEGGR